MKIYLMTGAWCSPCQVMKESIKELIGEEVQVIEVNSAEFDELANEAPGVMSIVSIPTILAIKDGEVMDSHTGVLTLQQTKEWIGQAHE